MYFMMGNRKTWKLQIKELLDKKFFSIKKKKSQLVGKH